MLCDDAEEGALSATAITDANTVVLIVEKKSLSLDVFSRRFSKMFCQ